MQAANDTQATWLGDPNCWTLHGTAFAGAQIVKRVPPGKRKARAYVEFQGKSLELPKRATFDHAETALVRGWLK